MAYCDASERLGRAVPNSFVFCTCTKESKLRPVSGQVSPPCRPSSQAFLDFECRYRHEPGLGCWEPLALLRLPCHPSHPGSPPTRTPPPGGAPAPSRVVLLRRRQHAQLAQALATAGRANPNASLAVFFSLQPACHASRASKDRPRAWGLHSMVRVPKYLVTSVWAPLTPPLGAHWQPCSREVPTLPPHTLTIDLAFLLRYPPPDYPVHSSARHPYSACSPTDCRILPQRDG